MDESTIDSLTEYSNYYNNMFEDNQAKCIGSVLRLILDNMVMDGRIKNKTFLDLHICLTNQLNTIISPLIHNALEQPSIQKHQPPRIPSHEKQESVQSILEPARKIQGHDIIGLQLPKSQEQIKRKKTVFESNPTMVHEGEDIRPQQFLSSENLSEKPQEKLLANEDQLKRYLFSSRKHEQEKPLASQNRLENSLIRNSIFDELSKESGLESRKSHQAQELFKSSQILRYGQFEHPPNNEDYQNGVLASQRQIARPVTQQALEAEHVAMHSQHSRHLIQREKLGHSLILETFQLGLSKLWRLSLIQIPFSSLKYQIICMMIAKTKIGDTVAKLLHFYFSTTKISQKDCSFYDEPSIDSLTQYSNYYKTCLRAIKQIYQAGVEKDPLIRANQLKCFDCRSNNQSLEHNNLQTLTIL